MKKKKAKKNQKVILCIFLNASFQEHFKIPTTNLTTHYPYLKPVQNKTKQKVWVKNNRLYIDGCTDPQVPCDVLLDKMFDFKNYPVYTNFFTSWKKLLSSRRLECGITIESK